MHAPRPSGLRHYFQTPTFALSLLGATTLWASLAFKKPALETPAFFLLSAAGAGVAIAFWTQVERRGENWGWRGVARSLRRPDRHFWVGFLTHVPQLVAAGAIVLAWRRRGKERHK